MSNCEHLSRFPFFKPGHASIRRWTNAARSCYRRGCRCEGCFYNVFFARSRKELGLEDHPRCLMKKTVIELVRVLGRPAGVETKQVVV